MRDTELHIPEPMIPDEEDFGFDDFFSYEDFDRMVLEDCGYDTEEGIGREILENVVAEDPDSKIFSFRDGDNSDDKLKQSFRLEDSVYQIISNPSFDHYWRKTILENLDDERDKLLLEQCSDSFIGDMVYRKLNNLSKLESLYFPEFFREVLSETKDDETLSLIDIDDEDFKGMPNVIRVY